MQTNISIRVVGFVWKQFHITWSHKRAKRPLRELAYWLRDIIRKGKDMEIPVKPHVEVNPRTETPVLGTMTDKRRQLNLKHLKTQEKMRAAGKMMMIERAERSTKDSMYDNFQDWLPPALKDVVGERIDVCWPITINNGTEKTTELVWCQGLVLNIVENDTVEVLWDAMPDIEGFYESCEATCRLQSAKWRKMNKWGWRKDLDVELYGNYYKDNDEVVREEGEDDIIHCCDTNDDVEEDEEDFLSSDDEYFDLTEENEQMLDNNDSD